MAKRDFVDKTNEYLRFLGNVTEGIEDPTDKLKAENVAMRAKLMELYAQIETLETTGARLRTEVIAAAKGSDVRKVAPTVNAPVREPNDVIELVASFRDGSKIERRRRNTIVHWWFSTPTGYIRVRSAGNDPYGVYVLEQRRAQFEAALVDQSKRLDNDKDPLCLVAYQRVVGRKLF